METQLGKDIVRKEAQSKVAGAAKYMADLIEQGTLYAKLLTSPHAHAQIVSIDTSKPTRMPGVKSVITGMTRTSCAGLFCVTGLLWPRKSSLFWRNCGAGGCRQ